MRKEHSIRQRLSVSYIFYILLFILFVGLLSNFVIQKQFNDYAIDKRETEIANILTQITNQYNGSWDASHIDIISQTAINNGLIITLEDENHSVIFDAKLHDGHQCEMVIDDIINRMKKTNPNWDGKYVTRPYSITDESGKIVGFLNVGYLSPYYYSAEDLMFLKTLNAVYLVGTLLFMLIALILASYMAKRLAKPIRKIVHATSNISKGVYDMIPRDASNILEINELTGSINQLSSTLKKQEDLRKQLTSDVTHELRTPMTTLQTHIEGMIDGVLDRTDEQLQNIYEEILRLNKLVSDLDKLAEYDEQAVQLNYESFNIGQLMNQVISIFKIQFQQNQIEIIYDLKDIMVNADKDKMNQVFINLISNALKYTPSGKWVRVLIEEDSKEITIKVKDSGIGISKKDLPHIFERLYRADKSRNRHTGGSGIGLSIVKSIVLAHNGKITATSQENEGTEITIKLPKVRYEEEEYV